MKYQLTIAQSINYLHSTIVFIFYRKKKNWKISETLNLNHQRFIIHDNNFSQNKKKKKKSLDLFTILVEKEKIFNKTCDSLLNPLLIFHKQRRIV